MSERISRKEFLKTTISFLAGIKFIQTGEIYGDEMPDIVCASNGSPSLLVRNALDALGGVGRFVKRGDVVVVKPNIGWDRVPEQAANTNPIVVSEIIKLCLEAGAAKVKVFDRTCNEPRRCYDHSGIKKSASDAGAEVRHVVDSRFVEMSIPKGESIKSWKVYRDALECDCLINVPIAKHHSLARLTLGIKNLMGVLGDDRGEIHFGIEQKLPDILTLIRPKLTIIDAIRILVRNGPQGGNLSDVKELNTVIAGVDPVLVDSYSSGLFNLDGKKLGYVVNAHRMGLGEIDITKAKIKMV